MAEIDIQRKKNVWPWIIGLIVLALVIWALFGLLDNNEPDVISPVVTEPVAMDPVAPGEPMDSQPMDAAVVIAPMPPPPTDADNTPIPVSVIVVGPREFLAQPVVGTATVAEVPSDRGFWIEQDGQRMFAMIAKSPNMEDSVNVNPGQQVRLAGVVYDTALASQIDGGLDAESMQIIADQPAFLLVDARNVVVVEG